MDSTLRFSDRVDNYRKYRPDYPDEAVRFLRDHAGLRGKAIADIGSGTGILTRHLLDCGHIVYAIEPNENMRLQAEAELGACPDFRSVNGTAEQTTLDGGSVDFITCAQALHWFDLAAAAVEFRRILRVSDCCNTAVIYNRRNTASDFEKEYEAVLREHIPDYLKNNHHKIDDSVFARFFGEYETHCFENAQQFDLPSFMGRAFSSSYTPKPGDANYHGFEKALDDLFHRYETDGRITLSYSTEITIGRIRED